MIFITGGTGLVGSHLLFYLTQKGEKIRALKRNASNIENVKKIFNYYSDKADILFSNIKWVEGDTTDIFSIYEALEGIKHVYHTAAVVSFNPSEREKMMHTNISGTKNIVNACLQMKIEKFCYISSIASLGRADNNGLIDENTQWKKSKNNSHYSISKYYSELEVWRGIAEGLSSVIVNPSVIIGPCDWSKGSSKLFQQVWDGLKFYTKGVNGYVDVRDVVKAIILLMNSDIKNERFIISSENIDYLTFFSTIADCLEKKRPSLEANYILGQLAWRAESLKALFTGKLPLITKETANTAYQEYRYSCKKIKKTLNFEFIPVADSIKDTCKLFLKEII